jgi:protein-L-isoaspartate(D-aspartate) O-methyltransferase
LENLQKQVTTDIQMKASGTAANERENASSEARQSMVAVQLRPRGIKDQRVLEAMSRIPREEFVPAELRARAYEDEPLPIGGGQTISQPYMVAVMLALLELKASDKVLEIGTGCGYQAALLACLSKEVYSVEIRPELARTAAERLEKLAFAIVHVHSGDGSAGLPEFAPYDAIVVAAAAPLLPEPLLQQLGEGGRLVAPVGDSSQQNLVCVKKQANAISYAWHEGCRFVPLVGRFGWKGLHLR